MRSLPVKLKFRKQYLLSAAASVLSALIMAVTNNTLIEQANLLPGGVMGLSRLLHLIGSHLGISLPVTAFYLGINIPVALFCLKKISRRFVAFSLLQVICYSFFVHIIPLYAIFNQNVLNVIFGGAGWGFGTAVALQGASSTGGTDFIALYVSTKTGNEIWMQVFAFNCVQLVIFGALSGWEQAGYSILFQFISTRMISTFHSRYKRMMLQVITREKDRVVKAYLEHFSHGITILCGTGGYTGNETWVLLAVTSSYEMSEAIELIRKVDPSSIINVTKSEKLIGKFQQPSL